MKQFIVLIIIIMIGVLISQAVQAQSYQRKNTKYNKTRYKGQVKTQQRACVLLFKKWVNGPKRERHLAARKVKYKPMAEIDARGSGKQVMVARKNTEGKE
jgi:hypothetical protein